MAVAAARVQVMLREKAKALAESKDAENKLDPEQREEILYLLERHRGTRFLSDLCHGAEVEPYESGSEDEGVDETRKHAKDAEDFSDVKISFDDYGVEFPHSRPHFLSERHYAFMKEYFKNPMVRAWDPELMIAYAKDPPAADDPKRWRDSAEVMLEIKVELEATSPMKIPTAALFAAGSQPRNLVAELEELREKSRIPDAPRWVHTFNEAVFVNQMLVLDPYFNGLVVSSICIAGILVGIQSYDSMSGNPVLSAMDLIIQIIFTVECIIKIFAQGCQPHLYWIGSERGWNNFDFWLVAICWLPGDTIGNVAFLRLLRLMRLLKLVGKVKQLQVIVQGLAKGLGSVVYIMILMILVFYLYAVLGVQSFRKNDPFHFGGLGFAMLSLFRAATKENWTHLLVINEFGCDSTYFGANGNYYGLDGGTPTDALGSREDVWFQTQLGSFPLTVCWHPKPQPLLSSVFFISFALIAGFVMLSLFVGAVCGGMADALDDFKAKDEEDKKNLNKMIEAENAKSEVAETGGYSISGLRNAFDACDEDAGGSIDAGELSQAMRKMGEKVSVATCASMIATLDFDGSGTLDFPEFVSMMTGGRLKVDDDGNMLNEDGTIKGEPSKTVVPERSDEAGPEKGLKDKEHAEALALVRKIRRAWANEVKDNTYAAEDGDEPRSEAYEKYMEYAGKAQKIAENPNFVNLLTITILLAGANVGVQTELAQPGEVKPQPALDVVDSIILFIFTVEVVVKLVAEGDKPGRYFNDSWNCFDFFIVASCFVFMLPFMPNVSSLLGMLRLLRLLRVLKLVKALPELRIIIEALISGFGSIFFVTIILFMFFYLYANIGLILFSDNDPTHFGNLQLALVSLFRAATMDDWTDIMYINALGCDQWGYEFGSAVGDGSRAPRGQGLPNGSSDLRWGMPSKANCDNPSALGWVSVIYFVSFEIFGSLVLLTLFIGIVATSMEEAKTDHKDEQKREEALIARARLLGIDSGAGLEVYREIFTSLDKKNLHKLDRDAMKPLVKCLPLVHAAMQMRKHSIREQSSSSVSLDESDAVETSSGGSGNPGMTRDDIDNLIVVVDENYNGFVDFAEFLLLLEFMKRVDSDPETLGQFRRAYKRAKPGKYDDLGPDDEDDEAKDVSQPRAPNVKATCEVPTDATKESVAAAEAKVAQLREKIRAQFLALSQSEDPAESKTESETVRAAEVARLKCEIATFEKVCEQMSQDTKKVPRSKSLSKSQGSSQSGSGGSFEKRSPVQRENSSRELNNSREMDDLVDVDVEPEAA